jgi:hypothetical protein
MTLYRLSLSSCHDPVGKSLVMSQDGMEGLLHVLTRERDQAQQSSFEGVGWKARPQGNSRQYPL